MSRGSQGCAGRVHADLPPRPPPERDRLPVQPRDDDAHLDPAGGGSAVGHRHRDRPRPATRSRSRASLASRSHSPSRWTPTTRSPTATRRARGSRRCPAIYSRLAALEMLLYPASAGQSGLVGAVSAGIASALSGQAPAATSAVPLSVMPVVLFIWGPGRIVPVRVTGLTITEKTLRFAAQPDACRGSAHAAGAHPGRAQQRKPGQRRPGRPRHRSPTPTRSRSARRSRSPTSRTRRSPSSG